MRLSKTRLTLVIASILAAAFALGFVVRTKRAAHSTAREMGGGEEGALRLAWPKGARIVYALTWKGDADVRLESLGDASAAASYDVAADLVVASYGARDGAFVLAASLERFTRHHLDVVGNDVLPDDASAARAFGGHQAWLEVTPEGAVRKVYFARNESELFKSTMQTVLSSLQMTLPADGARTWSAVEPTQSGTARSDYRRLDARVVARKHPRYDALGALPPGACDGCVQTIAGEGRVVLDPAGYPASIEDDESIVVDKPGKAQAALVSHASVAILVKEVGTFAAPSDVAFDPTRMEARRLDERSFAQPSQASELEQLVGGMTREALLGGLRAYLASGTLPRDFVGRAAALLAQHPEHCAAMVSLFEEPATSRAGRALVLDVLASAGTTEAQAAMRAAVGSPAAHSEAHGYAALVQRFSLLARPDAETAAFVRREYDAATQRGPAGERYAAAHALGAVAGELAKSGDAAGARAIQRRLRADVDAAKTPAERAALLGALGNVKGEDDVPFVRRFAASDDATVRAAAADALAGAKSHDGRATLLDLLGDPDGSVQVEALRSLASAPVDGNDARRIAALVQSGATGAELDDRMVGFLAEHAGLAPEIEGALRAILARTTDNRARARLKFVLDQMAMRAATP